jgi:hypothetical protein
LFEQPFKKKTLSNQAGGLRILTVVNNMLKAIAVAGRVFDTDAARTDTGDLGSANQKSVPRRRFMKHAGAKAAVFAAVFAMGIGGAAAAPIVEVEPNDPFANAQDVTGVSESVSILAERSFADPSDDFFTFMVRRAGLLTIVASSPDGSADSVMGLYGPGGALVASNDDGGLGGMMSAISFMVNGGMTGRYTVGLSGFNPLLIACAGPIVRCYDTDNDFLFDTYVPGVTPENGAVLGGSTGWTYTLALSGVGLIPEPGSVLLIGLAGALLLLRRRGGAARGTSLTV